MTLKGIRYKLHVTTLVTKGVKFECYGFHEHFSEVCVLCKEIAFGVHDGFQMHSGLSDAPNAC